MKDVLLLLLLLMIIPVGHFVRMNLQENERMTITTSTIYFKKRNEEVKCSETSSKFFCCFSLTCQKKSLFDQHESMRIASNTFFYFDDSIVVIVFPSLLFYLHTQGGVRVHYFLSLVFSPSSSSSSFLFSSYSSSSTYFLTNVDAASY
jgi:hypothetical protein